MLSFRLLQFYYLSSNNHQLNLLQLKTDNFLVINHLDEATFVLRSGNVTVLFADRWRQTADDCDVDCILRIVLATFTNLELHLVISTTRVIIKHNFYMARVNKTFRICSAMLKQKTESQCRLI